MTVSNNKGRVYRPKISDKLILHFKNLNHVKPDKWGTIRLAAFIQQVRLKNNHTCITLHYLSIKLILL